MEIHTAGWWGVDGRTAGAIAARRVGSSGAMRRGSAHGRVVPDGGYLRRGGPRTRRAFSRRHAAGSGAATGTISVGEARWAPARSAAGTRISVGALRRRGGGDAERLAADGLRAGPAGLRARSQAHAAYSAAAPRTRLRRGAGERLPICSIRRMGSLLACGHEN